MSATVTAGQTSLHIVIDKPLEDDGVTPRDDVLGVKVWGSTVNGFTPGAGNLIYDGPGLSLTIPGLTAGTVYYLRYALISEIDPGTYDTSAQITAPAVLSPPTNGSDGARGSQTFYDSSLTSAAWDSAKADAKILAVTGSATKIKGDTVTQVYGAIWSITKYWDGAAWADPGQVIDGNLVVTGTIGTTHLSATAVRGKTVTGNTISDAGGRVVSAVATSSIADFDITLDTAEDFSSSGLAVAFGEKTRNWFLVSYGTKTGNVLGRCRWVGGGGAAGKKIYDGFVVIPVPIYAAVAVVPSTGTITSLTCNTTHAISMLNADGGNAIAVDVLSGAVASDEFTYTSASQSTVTGISGLATKNDAPYSLFDTSTLPSFNISTVGAVNSVTLTSNSSKLPVSGGGLLICSTTTAGFINLSYESRSGSTLTFADGDTYNFSVGTYYIIPVFNYVTVGSRANSIYNIGNDYTGVPRRIFYVDQFNNSMFGSLLPVREQELGIAGFSYSYRGVFGNSTYGNGIHGYSPYGNAVYGYSSIGVGVYGESLTGFAGKFVGTVDVAGSVSMSGDANVSGAVTGNGSGLSMHVGGGTNTSNVSIYGGGSSSTNSGGTILLYGCNHSTTANRGRVYLVSANAGADGTTDITTSRMYINGMSATTDPGDVFFYVDDSEVFRLNRTTGSDNGFITSLPTYNKTTASAANMYVSSGGVFYRSTSAPKYKRDIEPVEPNYYQRVWDLEPIWYRSACEGDNKSHSFYGIDADKASKIDPRLVHWGRPQKKEFFPDVPARPAVVDDFGEELVPAIPGERGGWRWVEDVDAPFEPEGFMYERMPVLLLAALKHDRAERDAREEKLLGQVADLTKRLEKLEALLNDNLLGRP